MVVGLLALGARTLQSDVRYEGGQSRGWTGIRGALQRTCTLNMLVGPYLTQGLPFRKRSRSLLETDAVYWLFPGPAQLSWMETYNLYR